MPHVECMIKPVLEKTWHVSDHATIRPDLLRELNLYFWLGLHFTTCKYFIYPLPLFIQVENSVLYLIILRYKN